MPESSRKPRVRKPRTKKVAKPLSDAVASAVDSTAGHFTEHMMGAGASQVKLQKLSDKRHGISGTATMADGSMLRISITNKAPEDEQ